MSSDHSLSRKELLTSALVTLAAASIPSRAEAAFDPAVGEVSQDPTPAEITLEDLKSYEKIVGIEFTDAERTRVLGQVRAARQGYDRARDLPIDANVGVMTAFVPLGGGDRPGSRVRATAKRTGLRRPASDKELAYLGIAELGHLLRTKQVTSVELTQLYLARLKRHGDPLLCVVNLTEELALKQAARADAELKAGKDRGPLHGIPYGVKDLFATRGYPTTWGAGPYAGQTFDFDAAVVERLEAAGAVLVAKLSMGALAMGDVWFKGTTKNPFNLAQGSSGSSAGSASAVAAGLVAFAIGTETYGSITSPSLRCRVTGFRPTFGRVSRYGAMELSTTLDKIGPIARSVEDCALVFAAICGADVRDSSTVSRPFEFPAKRELKKLKVGWVGTQATMENDPAVAALRKKGVEVVAKNFTAVPPIIFSILTAECSSAFDEFVRSGKVRDLKDSSWPETFRTGRYIPAVEYLQAQRARALMAKKFEEELGDLDALLAVGLGGTIAHTNYGGHPQVMIPFGDDGKGNSVGRSVIGRLYGDDVMLQIAAAIQDSFEHHKGKPV